MQKIDLFPTQIFKFKIDPNCYNKQEILDVIIKNYQQDKTRNQWDNTSEIHHYYNDWSNDKFEKLPFDKLLKIYDQTIFNFMEEIKKKQRINYNWTVENVTVNAKHMESHDHTGFAEGGLQCVYSGVHFIKFDSKFHSPTTFFNPLMFAQFNGYSNNISNLLDNVEKENSAYFQRWNIEVEEDDLILFPSYLKHNVISEISDNNHRITSVINLRWKVQ